MEEALLQKDQITYKEHIIKLPIEVVKLMLESLIS